MGSVGCSVCLSYPFPAGCQDIAPLFGAVLSTMLRPRSGRGHRAPWDGQAGSSRAATRHRRQQIPQDTWLVAEIPFISLNCVTSNTAGGRISVDLSYWGWRVQNLAEKIYHARKIIAVVSAIYRREGQRHSAPSLPASGHRAPQNGAGIVGKTRWGARVAGAVLIPSVGCGRVVTVPWQPGP